ncbi:hypothetical protein [Aneurinibacillus migulanus]|uniref:Uncharacterized protein n=1 Tax=Aneurinibacillus migulanus TaxID=47500 RepID=A0A0D1Y771_ANEMI|nr:hypothetical protein [Aneurinibacillus migulanus]KIV60298.1 hypothetical protein TS65_00490 [Aneurinibacillus migulanus]KON90504.1 hypothetical protein AF333_28915 [Aneurinibacillus migulanus]MED0894916.1 hypothetical protein [Aneurinibacillus migulanus]MED1614441.1 hypothetical protein [Aneurinibacillus migulanus]SDJ77610.1 hypothetical protein SAMN04487909_12847 [Aneurinibacillus migulanus]
MGLKDVVIAILSLADLDTIRKKLRELADRWEAIYEERRQTQYENENDIWLWRKCGGIFYGAKTTVCTASSYYNASSKSGMGRMRECSSGAGTAAVGAEETEYEER